MTHVTSWLLASLVATVFLTTILSSSQALGVTRMNIPFLLGTIFRSGSRPASRIGFAVHLGNGLLFALVYVAAFHAWGRATWWEGAAIGLVHALFVLAVVMPVLPAFHPRMALADEGPGVLMKLEPPGFFALHYGMRTPLSIVVAHVAYGAVLGAFYR